MTTLTRQAATDLFRRPPDKFVDVGGGGGEIACRTVGTGPDVLFVHGWPVSGATYRLLLPHLVDHVTCHVIDLVGAGSSRFTGDSHLSVEKHIMGVRTVVDQLGLESVAVVGHDSGGMIARHAMVDDDRLRAMGLIDTEQSQGLSRRFKAFLGPRNLPGFGLALGWAVGKQRLRRNKFVLGDTFVDISLLDGEFDEFFLKPLHEIPARRDAATKVLRSFDMKHIDELETIHGRIDVPVQMVWGEHDPFLPVSWAKEMVSTFPDAQLEVIADAGLFCHEEKPAEVAEALLPVLAKI